MRFALVYGGGMAIAIVLFTLLARPRSNPLQRIAGALLVLTSTRGGQRLAWVVLGVLAVNSLSCAWVEPWLADALGYDMTAWVYGVEGELTARVQATLPAWAVRPLGWFYLSGFVALVALPALVWADEGRFEAAIAAAAGGVANYVLALGFYTFFPVVESGWSGLVSTQPLLDAVYAGLSADLRAGSALDNCFPSLHASMTVTSFAVVLARRERGDLALPLVTGVGALLTAYTIMALGVHWALDTAVGVPFGLLCAAIGLAIARRIARHANLEARS